MAEFWLWACLCGQTLCSKPNQRSECCTTNLRKIRFIIEEDP